jgi:hypothetical protein
VSLGIEYYGAIGPPGNVDRPRDQQHLVFGVLDHDLGENWEFNVGVGAGLTRTTDSLLIKSIVGYRSTSSAASNPERCPKLSYFAFAVGREVP